MKNGEGAPTGAQSSFISSDPWPACTCGTSRCCAIADNRCKCGASEDRGLQANACVRLRTPHSHSSFAQAASYKVLLRDPVCFARHASGTTLRAYQERIARAIIDSIIKKRGLTFVVVISRQGGKNETQAQIEAYLLTRLSQGAKFKVQGPTSDPGHWTLDPEPSIVKASPTWTPQSLNAMRRLERVLSQNVITRRLWKKDEGRIYRVGCARMFFFSAHAGANVVGATASTLLECDEAQDVLPAKWDKDFAPMAASTNATTVFWGTIWTSRTLLAREIRAAKQAEQQDGVQRLFFFDADAVAAEVPAYGEYVKKQVAKLGRQHPLVKTQYFLEEIDGEGGMFPPARRQLMCGSHSQAHAPTSDSLYALLVDVAGEDEDACSADPSGQQLREREPRKDSTAATIVEVDLATLDIELLNAPTYNVVYRRLWTGTKHTTLYGELRALALAWNVRYLVIDATGVGAGLASFLDKALPGKVIPYVFNANTKSDLGYGFLAVIDSGRFKDYREGLSDESPALSVSVLSPAQLRTRFERELCACEYEIVPGPQKQMRWGVDPSARDAATGEILHDDLTLSAALCAVLDKQEWSLPGSGFMVQGKDPLADMDKGRF